MNPNDRAKFEKEITDHKQSRITRKEKREAMSHQTMLTSVLNRYLQSIEGVMDDKLKADCLLLYNKEWINFVIKWNENPKYVTKLRTTEFSDFIKKYHENEKNQTS